MRIVSLDKRLRALEREIRIDPLPPFIVCGENEGGVAELLLINWWDNGVSKSWSANDGVDLPVELRAQLQGWDDFTA